MSAQLAALTFPEPVERDPTLLTVNDVLDAYLKEKFNKHAERICKHPKTIEYASRDLREIWGAMTLVDFQKGSKARIKAQREEWQRAGASPGTCRKKLSILKTAFRFCIEEEIVEPTLMPTIKLPVGSPGRERVLTLEEIARIQRTLALPGTAPHLGDYFEISLITAQRQGAILALRFPQHIDFEGRVIRFRATEAASERSKKRRTDIPMSDYLFDMLQRIRARVKGDAVISFRDKPVRNVWGAMKRAYEKAGVYGAHCHDLRRTAATLLGDLRDAAIILSDTEATTSKHYYHPDAQTRLPQVTKLSEVLAKARGK